MSKRISAYEDEASLIELMDRLGFETTDNTRINALRNIDNNKLWKASNRYVAVSDFLASYFRRSDDIGNQLRLPKTSLPYRYKIHIQVKNILDENYSGEVEIEVFVRQSTDYILLHSKEQEIQEINVYDRELNEIPILDYNLYPPTDTLSIFFLDNIEAYSDIRVVIKYSAAIQNSEKGFFRSSYVQNGVTKYFGATQVIPIDVRYVFPNYDEPEYKAVFELKITHQQDLFAMSNTLGVSVAK